MTRLRFAPKVPLAWLVQLYRRDALRLQDDELIKKIGARLYARCLDVLMISDSRLPCPTCGTEFDVPWIGVPPEDGNVPAVRVAELAPARITPLFEHQDQWGTNARAAFAAFVADLSTGAELRGANAAG